MQYNTISASIFSLILALAAGPTLGSAQDLGVAGPVWSISEIDMRLAMSLDALSVDWASHQAVLEDQARSATATLDGWQVPIAEHTRTRYIDPSITVAEDIEGYVRGADGRMRWGVLYEAGTRVNPLQSARPQTWQLVIDGTSEAQMHLATQVMPEHYRQVVLVLTRGDPGAIAKRWDFPVFFAQEQHFTRFGVTHTPSLVGVRPDRPLELEVTHFAFPYSAELVGGRLP